ncbi:MAG TPA: VapC toxin family PIN domain ribonuclease [Candidatus Dormibacteraeota bacterium]|nr:VapC toxin family PIN domain ribonuclease [Candidatus Dormibacteraeota bacterium]
MTEGLVLETAAFLDLLLGTAEGRSVRETIRGREVHVADHEKVGVGVALRALHRGGQLSPAVLERKVRQLVAAPFRAHPARELLVAAVARHDLRLGDALCVELSYRLAVPLITTDSRLAAAWPRSWLVTAVPAES